MSETEPNQPSNYKLTIENMWSVTRGDTGNWGIEGYEVPKEYFDHLKSKQGKDLWEKNNSKKLQSNWPPKLPKDENDKLVWPKRPNFIEDIKKWAGSYYNKEKSEKTIEELASRSKDWDKPPSKKEISKNLQSFHLHGDRKTSIDWIIHNEKKKYIQYPDKEEKINELKEKIEKERKEAKSDIQKVLEKFKTKGGLPKCDRITVVADSEYMGEKVPFCTEPKKETEEKSPDEGSKANKKFSYKTSYPSVLPTWNKDPIWTFNFSVKKDEEVKLRKKEAEDERYRTLSEKHMERLKKKNLNIELSQTFNKMLNFRKLDIGFGKLTCLNQDEKDLHKKWTEERPKKQPGPQQYWKTIPYSKLKTSKSMSKSESKYSSVENSDGTKTLMIDRKTTDKAIYKPMSSYIF